MTCDGSGKGCWTRRVGTMPTWLVTEGRAGLCSASSVWHSRSSSSGGWCSADWVPERTVQEKKHGADALKTWWPRAGGRGSRANHDDAGRRLAELPNQPDEEPDDKDHGSD